MDKDSDGMVSADEFIKSTLDPEFEKDEEWKPVVDKDEYTEDELNDYEKRLAEEARGDGVCDFIKCLLTFSENARVVVCDCSLKSIFLS